MSGAASGRGPIGVGEDALAEFLGLRFDDTGTVRLTVRPELLNGVGLLLGPVGFALVDYGMAARLLGELAPGERMATISIAINYVGSARAGDVTCRTRLDRRARQVAVLSSEIHSDDGRLLATAIGSYSITAAPAC